MEHEIPTKIIVSDLHLGAGGKGNLLEDFTSDQDFLMWVNRLARESETMRRPMDFIINGDFMEMLQVPALEDFDPRAKYPPENYEVRTELDAVRKVELVIKGHPQVFQALRNFVSSGNPRRRLIILWGNHDPELYWPKVQQKIVEAVGARPEEGVVLFPGRYFLEDGVYVEHGNQYTEPYNRFEHPDEPVDRKYPLRLEIPSGSEFVMRFFNDIEWERYWVDGVKPLEALVWYALSYDTRFALSLIPKFLEATPLLSGKPVYVAAAQTPDIAALSSEVGEREGQDRTMRAMEDKAYRAEFYKRVRKALVAAGYEDPWRGEPPDYNIVHPAEGGERLSARILDDLTRAAEEKAEETGAKVVVFGHTHEPLEAWLQGGKRYFNSGTWVWRGDFSTAGPFTWEDLFRHPEKYARMRDLTYVRVDYRKNGEPKPSLKRVGSQPQPIPSGKLGCLGAVFAPLIALLSRLRSK